MDKIPFRIVIIGGGIAGLSAAIALRGSNRDILVLEKSRLLHETGALISLQPNASKIVTSWGLDPYLQQCEPIVDRAMKILDIEGHVVNEIKLNTAEYGSDRILYHRQDLHTSLQNAARSVDLPGTPVNIRTACPVAKCDTVEGVVELQSGEKIRADLIIGADGIRSVVRSSVLSEPVPSQQTGLSAYRMLVDIAKLQGLACSKDIFDPLAPTTSLILGHDRRVIMGPGRGHKVLGIVALIPDEQLNELSHSDSWTSEGSLDKVLESFADFPPWLLDVFRAAPEISLWQLRDIPRLERWSEGRTILIGDAAHAMLPTQGQGASQSIEDAEALQALFADVDSQPALDAVRERLEKVFEARYQRASLIQAYSRQQALPATDKQTQKVTLNPREFMDYNCRYPGAKEWLARHAHAAAIAV